MNKTISIAVLSASVMLAAHRIPIREGNQVFGSTTVYVGPYTWPSHAPMWRYNQATTVMTTRYDFPNVTCNAASDVCTATCPNLWACESQTGSNLPNGTEVKFGTTGTLPAPLKSWSEDKYQSYYVRDSTTTTFRLAGTPGGSAIDITTAGSGTHGMSFAGYTHGFVLQGGYSKDFTCAAGTDTCTLTAHGYTTNTAVYLTSTGTLPAPLKLRYDTKWAKHCIIRIDDNTFKLKWIPDSTDACSTVTTPITFTDSGTGTHSFWNGAGTLTLWSLAGYPQGTTFSYRRVASVQMPGLLGNNKPQFSYSDELTIYAKVPAVTPPGAYPITITTSESSASLKNQQTSGFTLYAKLLQPLSKAGPSSYPPIPGLALWENVLVRPDKGGGTDDGTHGYPYPRCPNPANPTFDVQYPSSGGQQIWFYDGGASYYEMEDYFKDPIWRNCGTHIASSILATAVTSPTQGYFYAYTRTLQRAWAVTQDPRYKVALLRMSDPALGHPYTMGSLYDFRIREQSFSFARALIRRRITGVQSYFEGDYISSLVGMLDEISNGRTLFQFHQPFMVGLAMRELTDYYREHNDERIPVVIRQYLDRFWTDWYNHTTKKMFYNPEPAGDRCSVDCQIYTGSILNNLISPGYAFIWRLTGDDTYRVRGDDLFQYQFGPTFNTWPYQAKNWSEMNYWVWDYVRWRKGQQRAF